MRGFPRRIYGSLMTCCFHGTIMRRKYRLFPAMAKGGRVGQAFELGGAGQGKEKLEIRKQKLEKRGKMHDRRLLTLFFPCFARMLSGRGGEPASPRDSRCPRPNLRIARLG